MFMQYALKFSEKEYKEQVTDDVGKRFRKFMNTLGSKKIDYTGLNFVSCQYKEQVSKGFDDQMQFSGMIFVKDEKKDYKIPFIATWLETQRGWFGLYLRDILKKDEEESLKDSTVVKSVIVQKTEEEDVPPPPSKEKSAKKSSPRKNEN